MLTVAEAGLLGSSDVEHLAGARADGRVIFTQDEDFPRLHAAGLDHAGIVYAPQETSIGEIVRGLILIHEVMESEEMIRHIEFI